MDKNIQSRLSFINYSVDEVSLKKNNKFVPDGKPINISYTIDHNAEYDEDNMVVNIYVDIFDKAEEKNFPFSMNLKLCGIFKIQGEDKEKFEVNAIAILFPYIRSIISTYTANSNMPTLILPPINVNEYMKDFKKRNIK